MRTKLRVWLGTIVMLSGLLQVVLTIAETQGLGGPGRAALIASGVAMVIIGYSIQGWNPPPK